MLLKTNPSAGTPIYVQLMQQIKYEIESGTLNPGDQLPSIRNVAKDLFINPNTVVKVYKELEHEGIIELQQGKGAFVKPESLVHKRSKILHKAQPYVEYLIKKLKSDGLMEDEIRRLVDVELNKDRLEKCQ